MKGQRLVFDYSMGIEAQRVAKDIKAGKTFLREVRDDMYNLGDAIEGMFAVASMKAPKDAEIKNKILKIKMLHQELRKYLSEKYIWD